MKINISKYMEENLESDFLIVFCSEDEIIKKKIKSKFLTKIPQKQLNEIFDNFSGVSNSNFIFYPKDNAFRKILLIGLGKKNEYGLDTIQKSLNSIVAECEKRNILNFTLDSDSLIVKNDFDKYIVNLFTGMILSGYEFQRAYTEPSIKCLNIFVATIKDIAQDLNQAQILANAIILTRDLVNLPANIVNPEYLEENAKILAKKYKFGIKILNQDEIIKEGLGAFAAVSAGGPGNARLIVLEYGLEFLKKPILMVGKGVTFDSGGISLKPSAKMDEMRGDMAGAASILGLFQALGELKLEQTVIGIMPCTENMPSSKATRPGDVVKTLSGKTVEIINTDAEGRLILCDAITYGIVQYAPQIVVDIATLTGACIVALGTKIGGLFTNNINLQHEMMKISRDVDERWWPMPEVDIFKEDLKTNFADFKNVGGREGGASVAAVFLKQFIPEKMPWIHLDIAGTGWADANFKIYKKGGTGFGVMTLFELINRWAKISKKL